MDPLIGTINLFAGNFAPVGWLICDGNKYPVQQYQALFAIIGTFYGGDGVKNFAVPDLRGRVPVGWGQASTGTTYNIGQVVGAETVALTTPAQLPAHNHLIEVSVSEADAPTGSNNFLAVSQGNYGGDTVPVNTYNGTPGGTLNSQSVANTGNSAPHANMQPSLPISYIICYNGIFPTRN